jgi:hypothetical protein
MSALTRCTPIKPVLPVTNTCMQGVLSTTAHTADVRLSPEAVSGFYAYYTYQGIVFQRVEKH